MDFQRAIKWINGRVLELACLVDITNTDRGMKRINEEYNALLVARTAIYKQIPEKPEIKATEQPADRHGNHGTLKRTVCSCPACGKVLYIQYHFEYPDGFERWPAGSQTQHCQTCGQALMWKDDNHG